MYKTAKTNRLGAEISAHEWLAPRGRIPFVEDEIDHRQHGIQPRRQLTRFWKASRAAEEAASKSPKSRIKAATIRPQSER